MNEPNRTPPPTPERSGRRKFLAMLCAALFVGISLFAPRSALPPAPATAAAEEESVAATTRAVAAANAFLETLDAKQRKLVRSVRQ